MSNASHRYMIETKQLFHTRCVVPALSRRTGSMPLCIRSWASALFSFRCLQTHSARRLAGQS
eukprot:6193362-Pleurochrysis_carterae.AAC.3